MSFQFTEDQLEHAALEWFEALGYEKLFGPDIAVDGDRPERKDYASPILEDRLRESLARINKKIPAGAIEEALRKITIPEHPSLIVNNRNFQKMITDGVDVQYLQRALQITHHGYQDAVVIKIWVEDTGSLGVSIAAPSHGQE